jgi:hypothetical protein
MPFKSRAQAGKLLGKGSPLSEAQKEEWKSATDFSTLPKRVSKKITAARSKSSSRPLGGSR